MNLPGFAMDPVLETIVRDSAPALGACVDGHLTVETRSNLATARG